MMSITVTRDPRNPGRISPFLSGQFIEYLCDLVPGMWAEKLYDGGFEGITPYKVAFLAQTDFKGNPWYPCGAVNRAEFALDQEIRVSGDVSQRIRATGETPCTVGIAQDGIAVEKRKPCVFRVQLRGRNLRYGVRVRLSYEGTVLAACVFRPDDTWRPYTATFLPSAAALACKLTIEFDGPGTLWIDNASLMPTDTVGGWRTDVVDALQSLRPGIIRFGGSALDDGNFGEYEWRDTVGDVDRRKPFRAWGGLQPVGAGLEEIVQLCRVVGAEPLICVRFTGSTPKDAADEVEYFNGSADTRMGVLRAHNGHPDPYGIRYWQVGNERQSPEYAAKLPDFCRAMRAVDPSIKLLSSFPTPGVLSGAGEYLDYISPHQYDIADLDGCARELEAAQKMIRASGTQRDIKIAITEWNTTGGDWGAGRAKLWTLANALACARYHNLLCRHSDLVEIANRSNLTNSFCSGILQTDSHRLLKTPTYYVQQLYAMQANAYPLHIDVVPSEHRHADVVALLSAKGDLVTVFAVNDSDGTIPLMIDLLALGSRGRDVEVVSLADRERFGSPDVTNTFDNPERVALLRSTVHGVTGQFTYPLPPLSLTMLQWKILHPEQTAG